MGIAIVPLVRTAQSLAANLIFDAIERPDLLQGLGHPFRGVGLGTHELPSAVGPALGMDQPRVFFLEAGISGIAIAQEHRTRRQGAQELPDVDGAPAFGIGKADLLGIAKDRPEVPLVHLALFPASRLDGGLVHSQHARLANALKLGRIDGGQEQNGPLHEIGEPRATDPQALGHHPLMLPIERQVVQELIRQDSRQQADIGPAAVQNPHGSRGGVQGLRFPELDHRPLVFEDDIAAWPLGQAVADLGIDDLAGVGIEACDLGSREGDGFGRYPALIEEGQAFGPIFRPFGRGASMGGDDTKRRRCDFRRRKLLTETQLLDRRRRDAPFALLAEELLAEPIELALEPLDLGFKFLVDGGIDLDLQLPGSEGFGVVSGGGRFCQIHSRIITLTA